MEETIISATNGAIQTSHEEEQGKYLTFWTNRQLFGVSIAHVEQIVGVQEIIPIPDYPDYAKGVINLRGHIIPLIDLRLRFGKEAAAYGDHTCIIVSNITEHLFGFIVDEVDEVTDIPDGQISPPPQINADLANRYLVGIARMEVDEGGRERIILIVDIAKIMGECEYEALMQG